MNTLLFILLSLGLFSSENDQDGYSITGLTNNIADSTLLYLNSQNTIVDSSYVIGNKFKFTGRLDEPYKRHLIYTKSFKERVGLWVENCDIVIDAHNTTLIKAKITGCRIQNQSNEYQNTVVIPDAEQKDSLRSLMRKYYKTDSIKMVQLKEQYQILRDQEQERGIAFIKEHPDYELSAYFLRFLKNTIEKEKTQALYDELDEKVQNTKWGNTIAMYLEKSVKLNPGDKAVDFSLPDLNGKEVALSTFKGKYVLLEFWATGCGPCRMENPNLLKTYRKYKEHGFEILGVSLDESRTHWVSTVEKDTIIWTTVSDLKGMSGIVPITYSVYYIPNNYLIDKEGTVIAKDLRGDKLPEKLKEIFGE